MLALGAILAFSGGSIPLGIALMALGATSIASAVTLNWNGLSDEVKNIVTLITTVLSVAFLAVGAILAFSGANVPLGIALMALGAFTLGSAAAMNWDSVVNAVKKVVSVITGILGGALIVLGVLLCMSGVGVGLGLAVLAAGLGLSYAAWTLDDNPITNFVRKMANSVIGIINTVIDAINNLFHISFKGLKVFGEEVIPAFDVRLVNLRHIPTFADGGFVDQRDMMGSNVDVVTRAVIVIKGRNAVIDTTNRPVVTDVKIIESASGNSGILSGSDRRTKVFPPVDGIVRSGTGGVHLFQSGCVGLNERFQIGFEIGNGNGLHTVSVIQEKERTIGCACDNGQV